jgi:hypothetical protein
MQPSRITNTHLFKVKPVYIVANIVFRYPVALIYIFYTYFRLKCNVLYSHPSSSLHVSTVYGHHQVLSVLLKLLQCVPELRIACERDIS